LASKVHINKKVAVTHYHSDRNDFRSRLNYLISMYGWFNSIGKLFHSCEPATEKLLLPRHVPVVCGTVQVSMSESTSI